MLHRRARSRNHDGNVGRIDDVVVRDAGLLARKRQAISELGRLVEKLMLARIGGDQVVRDPDGAGGAARNGAILFMVAPEEGSAPSGRVVEEIAADRDTAPGPDVNIDVVVPELATDVILKARAPASSTQWYPRWLF